MFLDDWKLVEFKLCDGKPKTVCTVMDINTIVTPVEEYYRQSVLALATSWKSVENLSYAIQLFHSHTTCKNSCLVGIGTTRITKPAVYPGFFLRYSIHCVLVRYLINRRIYWYFSFLFDLMHCVPVQHTGSISLCHSLHF